MFFLSEYHECPEKRHVDAINFFLGIFRHFKKAPPSRKPPCLCHENKGIFRKFPGFIRGISLQNTAKDSLAHQRALSSFRIQSGIGAFRDILRFRHANSPQNFEHPFSNGLLSSARPFERPFTRPSFEHPSFEQSLSSAPPSSSPLRSSPPSNALNYSARFFAKYARIFRKTRLRIREQFSLRSMIRASPDSLPALNGVFLQNNKPFSLHTTLCLLFFFRTPL